MPLGKLNPFELGERLRLARENVGITQADAAAKIDIARTTLVAIEKGQRRIRTNEIQRLAKLYRTSVNALLRKESVHVDLVPRFRKENKYKDVASEKATKLLADLVIAEVELENLLGIDRSRNYPPERPILPGDVKEQAENDAYELRQWLGLGNAPIQDLVSLLEMEIGIRVYVRKLDSTVSGLFAFDEIIGACMLLNANHPKERRNQSAVHELGHFISSRKTPEILHENATENSREERYANAFGRAFLTPARSVRQKFIEITAGSSHLSRRHIILLAHFFGVSREAIVRRLEELGLIKRDSWDWFDANGGITNEQARQVLGDLSTEDSRKKEASLPTTLRLNFLAAEAWQQEFLSEGQLAQLLRLDRIELRGILDNLKLEGNNEDGLPKLPN